MERPDEIHRTCMNGSCEMDPHGGMPRVGMDCLGMGHRPRMENEWVVQEWNVISGWIAWDVLGV
jgi:hypothetical protein